MVPGKCPGLRLWMELEGLGSSKKVEDDLARLKPDLGMV